MKRFMGFLLAGALCAQFAPTEAAQATELYRIKLKYEAQRDSTVDRWTTLDEGELELRAGMSGSAFVGDAGVTLVVATAGERQYLVDLTLTTLPPAASVVSRQFVVDHRQDIEVGALQYERRFKARVVISIHPSEGELTCDFTGEDGARTVDEFVADIPFHGAPSMINDTLPALDNDLWWVDPSAHFELYYVPNTLGDFGWNLCRDFLEKEYQAFDNEFHLNRAQRTHFFISPCKVPEISWIPHRDWAIFPTTFKAYAVFNRDTKGLSGVPTNLDHIYRYMGYAPMCLAEGAARGFEYDHYYAKKLKWGGHLPRPSEWWTTLKYKSYPDSGLYIASGSFVSYLMATQGLTKFDQLYAMANDFNADSVFTQVYNKSFRSLEDDWLKFVDTLRIYPHIANYYIGRAKSIGRNDESIELLKVVIEVDTLERGDAQDQLALLYFLEGKYSDAISTMDKMPERYRTADRIMQMRNSALFFDGQVALARKNLRAHLEHKDLDGAMQSAICLMFGWLELTEGNPALADSLFSIPQAGGKGTALDQIEIALHRGDMRRSEGKHAEADSLYHVVLSSTQRLIEQRPGGGDLYLRLGEAYVGLGEADSAMIYLDMAQFLEYRPYYVGRVLVAIANAYDLLGMRDHAVPLYHEVLDTTTSYPARKLAKRFLSTPFRVNRSS
jgi:tetratricopeptide (TPR) repeat protein